MKSSDKLYRYSDYRTASIDEFGDVVSSSTVHMRCEDFDIIRRTPKGAVIDYYDEEKFVLLTARKRFAALTKEEALEDFKARKRRQIQILSAQLKNAESALTLAEGNKNKHKLRVRL